MHVRIVEGSIEGVTVLDIVGKLVMKPSAAHLKDKSGVERSSGRLARAHVSLGTSLNDFCW
jgi:hypothetical protein